MSTVKKSSTNNGAISIGVNNDREAENLIDSLVTLGCGFDNGEDNLSPRPLIKIRNILGLYVSQTGTLTLLFKGLNSLYASSAPSDVYSFDSWQQMNDTEKKQLSVLWDYARQHKMRSLRLQRTMAHFANKDLRQYDPSKLEMLDALLQDLNP
jgi:hypothetical protein